jgi:hypothetical protein
MAATHLREAYDCVVLGNSRTASQLAAALVRTGRQTLQLTREPAVEQSWLHPRWNTFSEFATGQRAPLSGVGVWTANGKRITSLRAATNVFSSQFNTSRNSPAESFALPAGCRVACDGPREIRLNGALPPTTIAANCIIAVGSDDRRPQPVAIGGIYRDVSSAIGEERHAALFATQQGSEVFWLVPVAGALWSIGLLGSPMEFVEETIADVFEEALVACPALTQRLISAELIGGLHCSKGVTESTRVELETDVVSLPDYSDWLDPVFSSGAWLGDELATQITPLLQEENASADRLTEFQQQWSAVEQLTRERIAPWYQQHEDLSNALHDHAQREWYERLLTGGVCDARR